MEELFVYLTAQSGGLAYLIIFCILVACGLGFPLPEDIPLIACGYLCWDGTMQPTLAFAVTLAGVVIGDTMLFLIGRKLGPAILDSKGIQAFFKPKRILKTRVLFRKYGDKIVFFARFVAGFRAVAFLSAGAMKMAYRKFITFDILAAFLSVPIWIGIGYFLGHKWGTEIEDVLQSMKHLTGRFKLAAIAIVLLVVLRFYYKFLQAKKLNAAMERQNREPDPPPQKKDEKINPHTVRQDT